MGTTDAGPPPIRARFEPDAERLTLGDVPWPDDLYLDESGRVSLAAVDASATSSAYVTQLTESLEALDGFGLRPTMIVRFDDALDARSLPTAPEDSLARDTGVFLLDADTSSPSAYERIPIVVRLTGEGRELCARPAYGRALVPGRRYALVVTDGVRAARGDRVAAAERFARVADPGAALSEDVDLRAAAQYAPVLATLERDGLRRERIVALSVFRTQRAQPDLADARALVRARALVAPTVMAFVEGSELDALLGDSATAGIEEGRGVAHAHVAALVQVTLRAPSLLGARGDEHGTFARNAEGVLEVNGQAQVPCTVLLPLSRPEGAKLPVAVVQHGLFGERADALPVGNALAAVGYAVIACDAPFHGSRVMAADSHNRFTDEAAPDGFGDAQATIMQSQASEPRAPDPRAFADAVRQGVLELFSLVYRLERSGLDAALSLNERIGDIELATDEVAFVGIDLGAEMGVALAAHEPALAVAALAFAGSVAADGWLQSPALDPWTQAVVASLALADLPRDEVAFAPAFDVYRMLVDRGGAFASAHALRLRPANLLMWMTPADESVPNAQTEALAEALGARLVGASPRFVPGLATDIALPGASIRGNFNAQGTPVTRVLQNLGIATHDALVVQSGSSRYEAPLSEPFELRATPLRIENPTQALLDQLAFFFASYRACRGATPGARCQASVSTLATR